ncbi:MAG TPA: hypothetical protein VF883_04350 [Thermoanaerobaculia bacterium]|jgi:hypothetical protein
MRVLALLLFATTLQAAELPFDASMCGTSPENDLHIRAARERVRERGGIRTQATPPAPLLREGAFYVQNDETLTPGYRPFDLAGQSLVFTPAGNSAYSVQRESLRYVEPAGAELRNFQAATGDGWHYVERNLGGTFSVFGRSVTRIYVSAFNGIHLDPPGQQGGMQFDDLEAAVHRGAVLSPLMITARKPRQLEYPRVFVDEAPGLVRVTWRSSGNAPFGYDVQAELRSDGGVTYSYRSVTAMRWGSPILSAGFDPATAQRTALSGADDVLNDVGTSVPEGVRQMINLRRVDVARVANSDLFAIRIRVEQAIDRTKLGDGEVLGFRAAIGNSFASVDITRDTITVGSFTSMAADANGASARVDGDIVEIYGIQPEAGAASERSLRVTTIHRPLNRTIDQASLSIPFTAAPRVTASDLSGVSQPATLPLPIAEPFVLGVFDPFAVWARLQPEFGLSDYDYDAVAMYQTHFTDMIFYAGAYSTGGNPQVSGIAPSSPYFSPKAAREPAMLHMNQLAYNYSSAPETASKVMLHEFGHRWLYFFSIRENGQNSTALSPLGGHPAAYVHTPSAFPVYGPDESSTMGGAFFTRQGDGSYKAHAANHGFSWHDLYLMGLAAPEEVEPWFYLAGTNLPGAYWPPEGAVVTGERRDVQVSQIVDAHGPRNPSVALSQKKFRVLFVLVTEEGTEPTDAEVAKLNEWRTLMERNFELATGGRGKLVTTFVRPSKKRAVR